MGTDDNQASSRNIHIYEQGTTVTHTTADQSTHRPVFAGSFFNYNIDNTQAPIILGSNSTITPNEGNDNDTCDGVTIQGRQSKIFSKTVQAAVDQKQTVEYALRGVHILGRFGQVFGENTWNKAQQYDKEEDGPQYETLQRREGPYLDGVLIGGLQASFYLRPRGVGGVAILGSRGTVHALQNNGVIIGGVMDTETEYYYDKDGKVYNDNNNGTAWRRKTKVRGSGIFICGAMRKAPDDPTIKDHDPDEEDAYLTNSRIQVSTKSGLQTLLKGYLKLDTDCTIYDANGNIIVKNGMRV